MILSTEIWAPLYQDLDRVLYGDLRLSGDNRENAEQNLGVGYRRIDGGLILGGHAWVDQRTTKNDSTFYQTTIGAEAFSDKLDVRANIYVPFGNSSNTILTPSAGRSTPYLAGTSLFVDTPGKAIEEAQKGFDIELGTTLPAFTDHIDSARVYGGYFHFQGDNSDTMNGWRARVTTDVTPWLGFGARYQHDNIRGSEGFFEATLRLPGKKSYKKEGLRARLDESPERDIDIVTGSKVTETGLATPVLNTATGTAQRIVTVDNTAAPGGDGSTERPYNNLLTAQNVLQAGDILYIRAGDGTTTGQNAGITIAKPNVQVIGSGTDFVLDTSRLATSSGLLPRSLLVQAAGTAPAITNPAGAGVLVTADNVLVSGISVSGASSNGIHFLADGVAFNSARVDRVTTNGNTNNGIRIVAQSSGSIKNASITNSTTNSNLGGSGRGIEVRADGGTARIENVYLGGNTVTSNPQQGTLIWSVTAGSSIGTVLFENNNSSNNSEGLYAQAANGGRIDTAIWRNNVATGNTNVGIFSYANTGSDIGTTIIENNITSGSTRGIQTQSRLPDAEMNTIRIDGNTVFGNTTYGIGIFANGPGGLVRDATVTNNQIFNNGTDGVRFESNGAGNTIENFVARNNVSRNNGSYGILVNAINDGLIGTGLIEGNITSSNNNRGVYAVAQTGGDINSITLRSNNSFNNTGASGMGYHVLSTSATSTIGTARLENNIASGNNAMAINVDATTDGTISNVFVTGNVSTGNNTYGIQTIAQSGGDIGTINLTNNIASNNRGGAYHGILVQSTGAGSTINGVTATGNRTDNNGGVGTYILANGTATINTVDITNHTSTANNDQNIRIEASSATSSIGTVTAENIETHNSVAGNGMRMITTSGGTITNATIRNLLTTGNAVNGLNIFAGNTAGPNGIGNILLDRINSTNNLQSGAYLQGSFTAGANITLRNSTMTANNLHGVYVDDDTSGTFIVDLGGGSLGGLGNNRIFGNQAQEMRVDLDGLTLSARNNWWGSAAGLLAGEIYIDNGPIDATSPLATDPGAP